jgi:iron-sulfur cluster insertion protein
MSQEKITVDLFITDSAALQIQLMKRHDFTLTGQEFRVHIKGKGCNGFDYSCGFTPVEENDIFTPFIIQDKTYFIIMNKFTAFYTQKLKIDYLLDVDTNEEGFIVENLNQETYHGKFYKDSTLLPPWAST